MDTEKKTNRTAAETRKVTPREKNRAREVFERLAAAYPDARCALEYHKDPFRLLIMTILSAQCTDTRVNTVSRDLFRQFRGPKDFAEAQAGTVEEAIRSCGFFRTKGRAIRESCRLLLERHGGKVPGDMESLLALPGVGRKIANVILGECFGVPGVVVDTHCGRVARRLGFTRADAPDKVERDLQALWPRETWTLYSHLLVFHGRAVCRARNPKCGACPVADLCPRRGVTADARRDPKGKKPT
ncbi:MAG: endonuclease III [Candidatus Hydrogenedentes bacterium]|nr:endonuclease III [Candidatus Hydrogenedentota bacterium]